MKKARFSGIELLRIIMMIQIIFLHFCDKGGYTSIAKTLPFWHHGLYYFVWLLSRCPVYVFMMLTGYFLIKKEQDFSSIKERIKKIYIPMLFYSIAITGLGLVLGLWPLKDVNIPKVFTPFLSDSWYFLTGYIILIILSPFLNRLANNLTKKEYGILILIFTFILAIWTPLANFAPFKSFISTFQIISNNAGKSLYDYIFMYLLGGYLALHVPSKDKLDFKYLLVFVGCGVAQIGLAYLFKGYRPIAGYNDNLFAIIQAVCLVLFFREMKFSSKFINFIATFTLPIYIIHEHYLLKWCFWDKLGLSKAFFESYLYPLKIIGICLGIFIACILIELVRRLIFLACNKVWEYFKSHLGHHNVNKKLKKA